MSTPTIGELERRVADLEARGEEWDEEIGMADGEPEPYEDNWPSLDEVSDDINTEWFGREGSTKATYLTEGIGGARVYVAAGGNYWLTSYGCLKFGNNGVCFTHPDELRQLADKIEEAER